MMDPLVIILIFLSLCTVDSYLSSTIKNSRIFIKHVLHEKKLDFESDSGKKAPSLLNKRLKVLRRSTSEIISPIQTVSTSKTSLSISTTTTSSTKLSEESKTISPTNQSKSKVSLSTSNRSLSLSSSTSETSSSSSKSKTSSSSSKSKTYSSSKSAKASSSSLSSSAKSNKVWRLFNVEVLLDQDPGKDEIGVHENLLNAISKQIGMDSKNKLESSHCKVIKKSFDGRWKKTGQPKFVYTVDVDVSSLPKNAVKIYPKEGSIEEINNTEESVDTMLSQYQELYQNKRFDHQSRIVIVGAGPAGLFAAVALVEAGYQPIIIERGQPVEKRGKSIGALFHRKVLDPESNLCYGEGGAGTWSDGKLTTRIGKNSANVRWVLEVLVKHGAPDRILIDGKPHLGTDRLVRILKGMRKYLEDKGVTFLFETRVDDFIISDHINDNDINDNDNISMKRNITGLILNNGSIIHCNNVILSVGHSARGLYHQLLHHKVHLEPKSIAAGFRIEHPQELINRIQYGTFGTLCAKGNGIVPVADYRVTSEVFLPKSNISKGGIRTCYSFCMCPGGQIVPTSVDPNELCINGMSFSKRQSQWANSALVVNIDTSDMILEDTSIEIKQRTNKTIEEIWQSPLRGLYWQEEMERRAAIMGGGNFVVPVQRVTDFLAGTTRQYDNNEINLSSENVYSVSINNTNDDDNNNNNNNNEATELIDTIKSTLTNKISSSYRLGVKESPCHELYPNFVTEALRAAILDFERKMPGFISPEAILHGVETRTSAPVQITRDPITCSSISINGLYPTGEGAGYAGGIVSAAVDGLRVAKAMLGIRQNET